MEPKTVLVVDDDRSVRDFLSWALKLKGYRIVSVDSAEEAKPLLNDVDLVMLDLALPKLSGEDLLRRAREEGNYVPTIVVSGTANEEVRKRLNELKIVDFIEKPFAKEELYEKVDRAVGLAENMKELDQHTERLRGFIHRQQMR